MPIELNTEFQPSNLTSAEQPAAKEAKLTEKEVKKAEKEATKEAKLAEKEVKKAEKEATKEAKLAEKETKKAEKEVNKAEKEATKEAKLAENETKKAEKEAEKEATKEAKLAENETKKAEKAEKEAAARETKKSNKGTGAGGANTNYHGKKFEETTDNQERLIESGYTKHTFTEKSTSNFTKKYDYYLSKKFEDKTIVFVLQNGLKMYMKNKYNIDLFRCPDEAYIIEYTSGRIEVKILEKKEQHVDGSVETKLWSGPSLKREYELVLGEKFDVFYGFCVNEFLKIKLVSNGKKYTILNTIFNENNIAVLFGDDENYFETIDTWIAQ